jgi:hypothetical protein
MTSTTPFEDAETLATLRPLVDLKVMDLVAEAGVGVDDWATKKGGEPVENPRANPNFCYDWAFGKEGEPIVLCVWYETLAILAEGIAFEGNLRARAKSLENIVLDRRESPDTRSRAKSQAKRCDRFDLRLQRAYRKELPVRVILLEGDRADRLGHDSSKVRRRLLDESPWFVLDYSDSSGEFTLMRGVTLTSQLSQVAESERAQNAAVAFEDGRYLDQFSLSERHDKRISVFQRSAAVRQVALDRAEGRCEYCGRPGFQMKSGHTYLETHHIVPLAEGGPDVDSNIAALCPEDHRRAHFGMNAGDIRRDLLSARARG